jgi:type VI secretion system FHA domain protein
MTLELQVIGAQAEKLGRAGRATFDEGGGTIGRAADNDWVLPNSLVSNRHAVISHKNGVFYIEDRSSNGIVIEPDTRLPKGRPHALRPGAFIFIKPFRISVALGRTAAAGHAVGKEVDLLGVIGRPSASPLAINAIENAPTDDELKRPLPVDSFMHDAVDPLAVLGRGTDKPQVKRPRGVELTSGSILSAHFAPPPLPPPPPPDPLLDKPRSAPAVPEGYNPLDPHSSDEGSDFSTGSGFMKGPAPVERVAPISPSEGTLAELLTAAGVVDVDPSHELAESLGEALRVIVSGVMDVLASRQQTKDEFRIPTTRIMPSDNNPLKFSRDVDTALGNLLAGSGSAYLGPVESFEDAFSDLRHHQLALLAGIRAAFDAVLGEFDPERLEQQFERQNPKKSLLGRQSHWQLYRTRFERLTKDPETAFRKLFGERFVKAYEEQLLLLKGSNGSGTD